MENKDEVTCVYNGDIRKADHEELGCKYSAGPLNINRLAKKAGTVMGAELLLDDNEFDILDFLASREDEYVTFDDLYSAIWEMSESHDGRRTARAKVDGLIKKINHDGHGFMWIEYLTEAGYAFKTHWGYNWKTQSSQGEKSLPTFVSDTQVINGTVIRLIKRHRLRRAELLAGVGAIAAAVILMLLFLFSSPIMNPPDANPFYIEMEDPNVPLASPDFESSG